MIFLVSKKIGAASLVFLFSVGCATSSTSVALAQASASGTMLVTCAEDPLKQKARSEELQKIVNEDQKDRVGNVDWSKVVARDEARRQRVGAIFGEGCIKSAQDFAAAALVFQHGVVPEHYFQTFLWAKRAVELGDVSQKSLMAKGIDRYLVNTNRRQLFATQASKVNADKCWCLEEVEKTFPEKLRLEYEKMSLEQALKGVDMLNQAEPSCRPAKFCKKGFKESPAGTIPGFW